MTIDHETKLKSVRLARSAQADPAPSTVARLGAAAILAKVQKPATTAGQMLSDASKGIED